MICYDVEAEPGLQPVTGEELNRGANQSHDAHLDVHTRGFWERQRSAYFDIRVCHPHADSNRKMTKSANMLQGSSRSSKGHSPWEGWEKSVLDTMPDLQSFWP